MSALTISHHIAAPLQVLPDELGHKAKTLAIASAQLAITDQLTFETGNRLLVESHQTLKDIEKAKATLKRPIIDLGKAIEQVVASVADPLEAAKRSLQGKVAAYQRAEAEKAAKAQREAEEKARQEREAAEQERARLQAIADEEHRQKVEAKQARAKAEADELASVLGTPVEAKPVAIVPAPKVEIAAPATPAPVIPAAPVATAIQTRRVPVLVFDDYAAVPAYIGGKELRPVDRAAVKAAINSGVAVPGARIELQEQTAMARQS